MVDTELPKNVIPNDVNNKRKSVKRYRKPHLEALGDLRELTLGGSPGVGDSIGSFQTQQSF